MKENAVTDADFIEQQKENNNDESMDSIQNKGVSQNAPVGGSEIVEEAKPVEVKDCQKQTETSKKEVHPLHDLSKHFLYRTEDMWKAYIIGGNAAIADRNNKQKKYSDKIKPYIVKSDEKTFSINFPSDIRESSELADVLRKYERNRDSKIIPILQKSLFIGIFSEFDAFNGSLLKTLFERRGDLLNSINRNITIKELLKIGSIEKIKSQFIEKEVESIRRESYIEQFNIMEGRFEIKTLKKFDEWSIFVEMSQRRNIMTHNDGVVNDQYLDICSAECEFFKNEDLKGKLPDIGKRLSIAPEYFHATCITLSIVAFMLLHTLWRKVLPKESLDAADSLTNSIYDLLVHERWGLAVRLGEFSLTNEMKKSAKEVDIRIRVINLAVAYKKCESQKQVEKLLGSYDWSATPRDFKLANAVLLDDFPEAIKVMRAIGKEGDLVVQGAYHEWPLFSDFRGREDFREAYKEIYSCDFEPMSTGEQSAATIDEILDRQNQPDDATVTHSANGSMASDNGDLATDTIH